MSTNALADLAFPLPPLEEQRRFTDLATRSDTLKEQQRDFARCDDDKKRVKDAYQSLFPDLPDANFDFVGASARIERQPGYASIASEREGTV